MCFGRCGGIKIIEEGFFENAVRAGRAVKDEENGDTGGVILVRGYFFCYDEGECGVAAMHLPMRIASCWS
jgi:hypothetical protein